MNHSLILFNGPPRSGKDECAKHLYAKRNTHWFRFSQPIKSAIRGMFDLTDAEYKEIEAKKDQPHALLFGKSFRDVQISFSEQWAKSFFGETIFGDLALRRVQKSICTIFAASDSGFAVEVMPFLKHFHVDDVLLVHLTRPDRDFTGDSRAYITLPNVKTITLHNTGTLHALHAQVDMLVDGWMERNAHS